jgi:hypothetical protein
MNTSNSKKRIAMKNEEKKNILTKEDLFRVIDSRLSTEEKRELMKADPADLHFGFGTWIRNEFIYSGNYSIDELYGTEEGGDFLISSPDVISGMIIDDYIKHLKGR